MSELDEIRTRHEAGERAHAVDDREWLLGEVERMTRECNSAVYALDDAAIEEARAEIDDCRNAIQGMTRDREEVIFHSPAVRASTVADRAVLLGEVERLRIAVAPGLHANAWAQAATARAARSKAAAEKQAERAAQLEAEVERMKRVLRACESWAADGGHADSGPGREIYLSIRAELNKEDGR